MIVGCYTLDLYCEKKNYEHEFDEFPHTFGHERGSVCRKQARDIGWVFHRDGTATCPKCNKAKKEQQ